MKHPDTLYRGERVTGPGGAVTVRVTANGRELTPDRSRKVWEYSPTGFEWGYRGHGPNQLAIALLLDATGSATLAGCCHHAFMTDVVAKWPEHQPWLITAGAIQSWLERWRKANPNTVEAYLDGAESFHATALVYMHMRRGAAAVLDDDQVVAPVCAAVRRCRVCSCTDDDCRECVAASGRPCYWMPFDPDLCSRCAEEGGAS